MTPRLLFRTLAFAEAVTWTLLIAGLLLRYVLSPGGFGETALRVGGTIHGFVFLAYGATTVLMTINQRWPIGIGVLAVASAVVPYATIPVELWLARTGRLEGPWRREATDHPRDRTWVDRTFRWFISRPWLFAGLLLIAVIVIFAVLLTLGPPGGR